MNQNKQALIHESKTTATTGFSQKDQNTYTVIIINSFIGAIFRSDMKFLFQIRIGLVFGASYSIMVCSETIGRLQK